MLRSGVSSNINIMIRGFATAAGNLESEQVAEKMNRRGDFVTPNESTYKCLINNFCKQDMFDDAYRVLNEMVVGGFSPSYDTAVDVSRGFLRIGDLRKAFEISCEHIGYLDEKILQGLSDEVTYTSLMNACLDEGKWGNAEKLLRKAQYYYSLPSTIRSSVIINGLDKKDRTTEVKKYLLGVNYKICPGPTCIDRPILEYHSTMVENSSYDEFKSVVELVEDICRKGLRNVFDTMFKLKLNCKPDGIDDGIVYNLFIFAHCRHSNADEAYIMYKEMVHYGFACHMFTVFALIKALYRENMVNELLWVIQNVLRSCNLNDSEIVKFLNEFNPKKPNSEALFDVLVEKAKDGLFLKCSYAPASV
ncbi:hypothetical protein TSUD_415490 [Trifolium subterraneum]|uniref:Pentacotripeptide-repeat region of PRORP domain-containing protein n=1 Tax=Trifolium subterraneum TaxID=3900 RepID=A0A2Z6PJI5_TRISU|nr:hypothetical protein TSUD_415490 [Trifolium subterraneum]